MNSPISKPNIRIKIVYYALVFCFMAIVGKVVFINTSMKERLMKYRYRQSKQLIRPPGRRGSILDRRGNVLAMEIPCQTIYAVPEALENKEQIAARLANLLGIDKNKLLKAFKKNDHFAYVKRRVSDSEYARIKSLNFAGIGFLPDSKRVYPNGKLAASVIGIFDGETGVEGIEASYEKDLHGKPGEIELAKDARGHPVPNSIRRKIDPITGNNVQLTLDPVIQYTAEKELEAALVEHNASSGAVVVMDPKTGKIHALASAPGYDPGHINDYASISYHNFGVTFVYEPGSVMKPLVVAAAIEAGIVTPNSPMIYCSPSLRVDGYNISEAHAGGYGTIDPATIVIKSSNVGMAKIGTMMGWELLSKGVKAFGFGHRIKIGLNGSPHGWLPSQDNWPRKSTIATVSYGHGIMATPLQLASMYAALANDGVLMEPMLVERIVSPDGKVIKEFRPSERGRVVSPETARKIRDILKRVIEDGTGQSAQILNYDVGGKTGTAVTTIGGHYASRYVATFAGMAPIDNPRLIVVAVVNDPKPAYYASIIAAPLFKRVMAQTLLYMKVPPTRIVAAAAAPRSASH